MMINYIRYTDCNTDKGDIVKTEFFWRHPDANKRRLEVTKMAQQSEELFFDDDIHIIEYTNTEELIAELNKLNSIEFDVKNWQTSQNP